MSAERAPFRRLLQGRKDVDVLLTGMGATNANRAFRAYLRTHRPGRVITAGFCGALNPVLPVGTVLHDVVDLPGGEAVLRRLGSRPARFHCSDTVLCFREDKAIARKATGADAVDMESLVIQRLCREHKIPCGVVRVVSDAAGEELPLNFNALMTPDQRLDARRVMALVLRRPGKIPVLLRFHRQTKSAAEAMARVLAGLLEL